MNTYKAVLLVASLVFVQEAIAQKELTPEPGALAELDRYDLKLREAFSESYGRGIDLRAIFLPSFSPEVALFVDGRNIVTLSPRETSIWSHEHRELVRRGAIMWHDASGRKIPPDEEKDADKKIPEKVSDIDIKRLSRPLEQRLLQAVFEVWEDAVRHATHVQEAHVGLDGARWHYSVWIRGRGVLSGTVWSPEEGSIPSALNEVCRALIGYVAHEANESHVASALWKYKTATKARVDGVANISIEKPPKLKPIPISVYISRDTILERFSADTVSLKAALGMLTDESAKWGKALNYEGISFLADEGLQNVTVTYKSENESMKSICEALAEQAGADLNFKDSKVEFVKKPKRIEQVGAPNPLPAE